MLPSHIELNYFYEVANSLSFTQAALKLNISQPSLSQAVKKLEARVGETLFIRHKQGVSLTLAGKVLYDHTHVLLAYWANTLQAVQKSHQEVAGDVILGCNSTISPFISEIIHNLITTHPLLKINLQHALLTPGIMKAIANGSLDLGIVFNPQPLNEVVLIKLVDIKFNFWRAAHHSPILDYSQALTIFCDTNLPQTQYLLNQLQATCHASIRLNSVNQLESVAELITKDCGIGILPDCFVYRIYQSKLTAISNAPSYMNTMYLAYHAQNRDVAAIQVLRKALQSAIIDQNFLVKKECISEVD